MIFKGGEMGGDPSLVRNWGKEEHGWTWVWYNLENAIRPDCQIC